MTVANAEEMEGRKAFDIGSQDVLVLVNFIGVVRVVANSGSECELPDAVLSFFVCFLWLTFLLVGILLCILERTHSTCIVL